MTTTYTVHLTEDDYTCDHLTDDYHICSAPELMISTFVILLTEVYYICKHLLKTTTCATTY
uniref:Uncharacterized protein n=1 Tax=Arion vulgaris TaxID=1028688 RepID=A0A0B6XX26_9EUPU